MFLNSAFPINASFKSTLRFSLLSGLIVFLILVLFRPFNIDGPDNHLNLLHPLIYGLATLTMVMLNSIFLPIVFPPFFKEQDWTLGREILVMCWQIFSISFVNLIITHFLFDEPLNGSGILKFLFITTSVGIFPVTIILLIKQQLLYKKFTNGAFLIENELQSHKTATQDLPGTYIIFRGDNNGEACCVLENELRFITAADNYLRIFYSREGRLNSSVIRSSLKKVELLSADHPKLFRCHRAYIVNLSSIEHVSGNAQGLKLHLKDVDELIPVSRSLNDELKELLKTYSK